MASNFNTLILITQGWLYYSFVDNVLDFLTIYLLFSIIIPRHFLFFSTFSDLLNSSPRYQHVMPTHIHGNTHYFIISLFPLNLLSLSYLSTTFFDYFLLYLFCNLFLLLSPTYPTPFLLSPSLLIKCR